MKNTLSLKLLLYREEWNRRSHRSEAYDFLKSGWSHLYVRPDLLVLSNLNFKVVG